MPKGIPRKQYSAEFKQQVIETMRNERLSCQATAERFGIHRRQIQNWERLYLAEGAQGLYIERRGRSSKGRPCKFSKASLKGLPPALHRQQALLAA